MEGEKLTLPIAENAKNSRYIKGESLYRGLAGTSYNNSFLAEG